ncbi:Immunity protein 27 [Maribacter orientalis]|uniref:Immunity protein 27 n=1 Tax=Maribacter orientalis TaxID=228957 RepID=A0A1H7XIQ0_9FLAO|nr:Imm27 family immunity protein [Maribacter orientalis]SEM33545.1 Immunity protein 27 [Maribacter orientalis]
MTGKEIIGKWKFKNGRAIPDSNCKIIEIMIKHDLIKIGTSKDGWTLRYKAIDGTNWELSYPESHLHGGGPPKLVQIV